HGTVAERQHVLALEADGATDNAAGGIGDQPHEGERGHALAAAGLAHHAHGLAGVKVKADAVDGGDEAARTAKDRAQPHDLKQVFAGGHVAPYAGGDDSTRLKPQAASAGGSGSGFS